MKKLHFLLCLPVVLLLFGCAGNAEVETETPALNPTSTYTTAPTLLEPSPTVEPKVNDTAAPTAVPTTTQTGTPVIPPEAQLNFQCLDVTPTLPHEIRSNGNVILENRVIDKKGFLEPGTFLLDMETGGITQISAPNEGQSQHIVSPDKKLMAYTNNIFDSSCKKIGPDCEILNQELVVSAGDGQPQKVLPLEEDWWKMLAWMDNQHLAIQLPPQDALENSSRKPLRTLILNPFTGERQILVPDFPDYLDTPSTELPWWDGWSGVIYDPQIKLAIYPRFLEDDDTQLTYEIWDLAKGWLVASLEDIFTYYSILNDRFPMPLWSPDGMHFVMKSAILKQDHVEYELFLVGRDGQAEQLTHLTSLADIRESYYGGASASWSPDGRYIALYLGNWGGLEEQHQARVAALDTLTHDITDYCFPVIYGGEGYGGGLPEAPIWSPDGKQLLVVDWYEKDHRRVILVDTVQGFAAVIAEDMQPVGWLVSP